MSQTPRVKEFGGFRFKVTEEDIANATRNNSMQCVVAQCIARTIPNATRISVDIRDIRWTADGERFVYLTPYSIQGYVVAFDAGDEIRPFGFYLDSRNRVAVQQKPRTPTGLAKARAQGAVTRAKAKATKVRAAVHVGQATEAALEDAETKVAMAEDAVATIKAHAKEPEAKRTGTGRAQAPPRTSPSNTRHYGHRVLRINQQTP